MSPGTRAQALSTTVIQPPMPIAFPGVLGEIAEAAGAEAALKIAAAHGGRRCYFPPVPQPGHWLCELVGEQAARRICQALTGGTGLHLLVPMDVSAGYGIRWRRMRALIDTDLPKREIARICGVHERTVQRHRNDRAPKAQGLLRQFDFFET